MKFYDVFSVLGVVLIVVYGLLMLRKYSVAMLVSVFLLCLFSVKISIKKSILLWRYFSVHILHARDSKPLNTTIAICGAMLEFGFICTFVIDVYRKILK